MHIQPHNCHGPIATAAAVQLDACITNFIIQETIPLRSAVAYELVNEPLELTVVKGGLMSDLPAAPSLGVTLNRRLVGTVAENRGRSQSCPMIWPLVDIDIISQSAATRRARLGR